MNQNGVFRSVKRGFQNIKTEARRMGAEQPAVQLRTVLVVTQSDKPIGAGYAAAGRDARRRLARRGLTGGNGNGCQLAMLLAHNRVFSLLARPGNSRRSSTAAASSPPCSKASRIAAASASDKANIPGA